MIEKIMILHELKLAGFDISANLEKMYQKYGKEEFQNAAKNSGYFMKMMTLEESKEYTREKLAPYYDPEKIENIVNQYVSVARPGVVLVRNENVGLMELYL